MLPSFLRHTVLIAAIIAPMPALAANDVALSSEMFVERTVPQPGGGSKVELVKPKSVPPGAKLVFVLSYTNKGRAPATNFVVTNPMPNGVQFVSAEGGAVVSVNGGQAYAPLATAQVRGSNGAMRAATADDVTHIRWVLKAPIPVGGTGKLSFRGSVK